MLPEWENKYRAHWPHHYRDVLDKVNSPLGMVAVNDVQNLELFGPDCGKPLVTLEKSFKQPTIFKVVIRDSSTGKLVKENHYPESELKDCLINFLEQIGGWEEKAAN